MQIIRALTLPKHADWLPTFLRDFWHTRSVKATALAHVSDDFLIGQKLALVEAFGITVRSHAFAARHGL